MWTMWMTTSSSWEPACLEMQYISDSLLKNLKNKQLSRESIFSLIISFLNINSLLLISKISPSSSSSSSTHTKIQTNYTISMEPKELPTDDDEMVKDSPIEQVRLTVPTTDDPTLPTLTFRTWLLGPITCLTFSILVQYSSYRRLFIGIDEGSIPWLLLLTGKLMAAKLPTKTISIPGTKWTFSMNPGPFNVKEHTLLVILVSSGFDPTTSLSVISVTKGLYHKSFPFWGSFMLVISCQMIGYGFAGIFVKFLVESPYMWWPALLPSVSLYRMVHDEELRPKGRITRTQFYIIVAISSFAYSIITGYFFPSVVALSFVCWVWKDSVTAQQIGSGLHGLGIGSFTFDWISITNVADPLVIPFFVIVNMAAGFILITYIIAPINYWTNLNNAKRFPFISNDMFDVNGQAYNLTKIITDDLSINKQKYNSYPIYWSGFLIYTIGFQIAAEVAAFTHFLLYHAREVCKQVKQRMNGEEGFSDVHNRLMKKYEAVPQWWFYTIIVSTLALAMVNCMLYGKHFQLTYWAVVLGYSLPFILILPVGVIQATTGQSAINMYLLSPIIMGLIYPGKPIANLVFRSYTQSTMGSTMGFLYHFKLAHYMKIPPKSMFIAQITGTFISSLANLVTQWWIFSTIKNICNIEKLPEGSPWTCPSEHWDLSRSMIWGGIGPRRMFASHGQFFNIYIFVIIGVIATLVIWKLTRKFPEKKWLGLIHIPLIFISGTTQPPLGAVNYWSSLVAAFIFKFVIYKRFKEWYAKYGYLFSGAFSVGATLRQVSLTWSLKNIYGLQWWGLEYDDHCPLANCPTAPGIKVDGCPVF